jgi:uncharacterized membrane protein
MAWLIWLPLFARSLLRAPWRRLKDSEQMNVWLGMVVLLMLIWSLKAGVKPGLDFHLLGATIFTLCFGPHLAFIGLCAVLAGITLNGAAGSFAYAINALLLAGGGVVIAQFVHKIVCRCLPAQFFIFIFVNSFFGAALTILGVGLLSTVLMSLSGTYPWDYLIDEYLPYFMLLGFSEAWLSGMLTTLFVIYRPEWIVAFDDSRYLANK